MALSLFTVLAPQALDVRGTTRCPSPTDVLDRLAPLLSADTVPPSTDWLELRDIGPLASDKGDLEMRLNRAGLKIPLGVRRLQRGKSCAETVDSVAVIAASWIADYPTAAPPAPPLPEATDGDASRRADPAVAPDAASTATARPMPLPAQPPADFALGAAGGVVAGLSGGFAPSLQIEGEVAVGTRWLFRLAGIGTGTRDIPFGAGKVSWQGLTFFPAAVAVWRGTFASFEIGAGPLLALTRARGLGFPVNGSDTGPNIGAAPTARLGRRLNRLPVEIWLATTTNFWLRPPRAQVDSRNAGDTTAVSLPAWDVSVAAGVTFLLGR